MPSTDSLLEVRNLTVRFPTDDGPLTAVDELSFDVGPGETLGIVGESGSGKSVTSMAILGLLPKYATITGSIRYHGEELIGRSDKLMRPLRGEKIAMVFQDALASLNPVFTVGDQIEEAIAVHHDLTARTLKERAIELMEIVGIPNPTERYSQYPHEFSGGMRQRAMIAMSIANEPEILIADEPTTALDVTIQAQVMEVIRRIQSRTGSSMMLITHDLGVVAGAADRVLVMYAGRGVEVGDIDDVFYEPSHPYTRGLLASLPRLDRRVENERLYRISGQPPSLLHLPKGCAFTPRCDYADRTGLCTSTRPEWRPLGAGHLSSCHFAESLGERASATT
jgi:oligopeptide/dipeptide ABC transporter ATP-binding protein